MADTIFVCGRYNGKTYEQVADTDLEFCQDALKCKEPSKYYPEEFKQYLKSKMVIRESGPPAFLDALNAEQREVFHSIVGKLNVQKVQVHDPIEVNTCGFLGRFCRLFVPKCICSIQHKDVPSSRVDHYASIFPFKVKPDVGQFDIPVKRLFDHEFKTEVADFCRRHFGQIDFISTVDLFLRNIYAFRRDYFTEDEVEKLNYIVTNRNRLPANYVFVNEYLKNFPRPNDKGVNRFKSSCRLFDEICLQFDYETPEFRRGRNYFLYAPEINFQELFLLLDDGVCRNERRRYMKLFLKYIFFFENAVRSGSNPVFFIDDVLFECLKWQSTYRSVNGNLREQNMAVAMLALVQSRKKGTGPYGNLRVDDVCLQRIRNYLNGLSNIELAIIGERILTDILDCKIQFRIQDTLYDVCFSTTKTGKRENFGRLILQGALYEPATYITKLVLYNAKTGCEYRADMPEAVDRIRDFVRECKRYSFSTEPSFPRFLPKGCIHCYAESTIKTGRHEAK